MSDHIRRQPEPTTNIGSIFKEILKGKGILQAEYAEMLGYKHQSSVAERFRTDIKVSTVVKMLDSLGYDLVVMNREDSGDFLRIEELDDI